MPEEIKIKQYDGHDELAHKWYCSRLTDEIDPHTGKPLSHYLHPDGQWRKWVHWYDAKEEIIIEEEL